jgi:hypothetical protein
MAKVAKILIHKEPRNQIAAVRPTKRIMLRIGIKINLMRIPRKDSKINGQEADDINNTAISATTVPMHRLRNNIDITNK